MIREIWRHHHSAQCILGKIGFERHSRYNACRQDLTAAKAAIEELFGKIREIRRKAEASEIMVQEICRDIRKLDFAKTHLTHTITALRRLAMLVNAVGAPLTRCSGLSSTHDEDVCRLS